MIFQKRITVCFSSLQQYLDEFATFHFWLVIWPPKYKSITVLYNVIYIAQLIYIYHLNFIIVIISNISMFNISSYSQFLAVKIQDENDWQWIIHLAEDDWGDVGLKLEHLGFYSSAQEEEWSTLFKPSSLELFLSHSHFFDY